MITDVEVSIATTNVNVGGLNRNDKWNGGIFLSHRDTTNDRPNTGAPLHRLELKEGHIFGAASIAKGTAAKQSYNKVGGGPGSDRV